MCANSCLVTVFPAIEVLLLLMLLHMRLLCWLHMTVCPSTMRNCVFSYLQCSFPQQIDGPSNSDLFGPCQFGIKRDEATYALADEVLMAARLRAGSFPKPNQDLQVNMHTCTPSIILHQRVHSDECSSCDVCLCLHDPCCPLIICRTFRCGTGAR